MGIITFNGISSDSLGVVVEHHPAYQIAEPDIEITHIPGRNGDLMVHTGFYKNVNRSYDIAFVDSDTSTYRERAMAVAAWLFSPTAYTRLEDTYEEEYYREAMCTSSITITNILERAGRCTVDFNCKPQRFLKTGEEVITIESGDFPYTIQNPTNFTAIPDLRYTFSAYNGNVTMVHTAGKEQISTYTATVPGGASPISKLIGDLREYVFDGADSSASINQYFSVPSGNFPIFRPGPNRISIDAQSNFVRLEVTPKWWTL